MTDESEERDKACVLGLGAQDVRIVITIMLWSVEYCYKILLILFFFRVLNIVIKY